MSDRRVPQDVRSVDWLVALIIGGALVVLATVIAGLIASLAGWMVPIAVIALGMRRDPRVRLFSSSPGENPCGSVGGPRLPCSRPGE